MYTLYFCFRFEDDAYQRSNMLLLPLSLRMIPKRRFPTCYIHNMNPGQNATNQSRTNAIIGQNITE